MSRYNQTGGLVMRSKEEREKHIKYLMNLPLNVLRQRQSIVDEQKTVAYNNYVKMLGRDHGYTGNWDNAARELDMMSMDLIEAIDRKSFKNRKTKSVKKLVKKKRTSQPPIGSRQKIAYYPVYKEYDDSRKVMRVRPDGSVRPIYRRITSPPAVKYFEGEAYYLLNDHYEDGKTKSGLLSRAQAENFARIWRKEGRDYKARIIQYGDGYCVYGV
jgi:hypothetical protein